jgi:transketolase
MGITHHATEDIAMMRAFPGLTVFVPCDPYEASEDIRLALEIDGPCYIRLGKGGEPCIHSTMEKKEVGKATVLREGKDVTIFAVGPIIGEAIIASDSIRKKDIGCGVYSFHTVKPIDKELILQVAQNTKKIITLEEHSVIGGFASAVAEVLSSENNNTKLIRMGLNDEYSSRIGSQSYLRKYYGMDAVAIEKVLLA